MGLGAIEKGLIGQFVNDTHNDLFKVCLVACLASIAEDLEEIRRRMPKDTSGLRFTPEQKKAILEFLQRRD